MASDDEDDPDKLVIEGTGQFRGRMSGAGEFRGRSDGKTEGRGMLGLISAIPPAPKLPKVDGVRMLAPTIPSERPGRSSRSDAAAGPLGLPPDAVVEFAPASEPAPSGAATAEPAGTSPSSWPEISWKPGMVVGDSGRAAGTDAGTRANSPVPQGEASARAPGGGAAGGPRTRMLRLALVAGVVAALGAVAALLAQ